MTLQETVLLVLVLRLVLSHVYEGTIYWGTNAIGGPGMWNVHVHPCIEEMNNVKTDAAVHRIVSFALMVLACYSCF